MIAERRLVWLRELATRYRAECRGLRLRFALVMGATVLWVGIRLVEPWPLKLIIDGVLLQNPPDVLEPWAGEPRSLLLLLVGVMLMLGLTGLALRYAQRVGMADLGLETGSRLRRRMFAHLLGIAGPGNDRRSTGDLAVRLMSDIRILRDSLVTMPVRLAEELLLVAGMVVVMFWIDWQLAIVALALPTFLIAVLRRFRLPIREAVKKQRERESQIATTAGQALAAMMTVQAYGQEKAEIKRFGKAARKDLRSGLVSARLEARMTALIELGVGAATAGIIAVATLRIQAGSLTPGDLVVFAGYLAIFYTPLRRLARTTARAVRAREAGRRIDELLAEPTHALLEAHAVKVPSHNLEGAIEFDSVSLRRPGRTLLSDISFAIRPGEHVCVIGPTGAGKSTLLSLIPRLCDPHSGRILLDGHDVRDRDPAVLRRGIAIVFQSPMLLSGTIAENIALGRPDASRDAIETAAELAGIAEIIDRLPRGFDTSVGEAGRWLSGGQQRAVAIARAVVMDAPIVLLDEPTVGLDSEAKTSLRSAIDRLGYGRTVVAVTHDASAIPESRRVILLNHGRVIADSTYRALRERRDLALVAAWA